MVMLWVQKSPRGKKKSVIHLIMPEVFWTAWHWIRSFQSLNEVFCSTCRPLWRCLLSLILPPSLNLPVLLPWDRPGSDSGDATRSGGLLELLTRIIGKDELFSRHSAKACDRLRNGKPQRISLYRVRNLSHRGSSRQGVQPQGLSPLSPDNFPTL